MIDSQMTKHLAKLSGLEFSENELKKISADMEDIIKLMDKIKEIDFSAGSKEPVGYDSLRPDLPQASYDKKEIMKNSKTGFEIPKIM